MFSHLRSHLKKRLLENIEDDIHTPTFSLKLMVLGQQNFGLEGRADNIEDSDLKNRAKYIHS